MFLSEVLIEQKNLCMSRGDTWKEKALYFSTFNSTFCLFLEQWDFYVVLGSANYVTSLASNQPPTSQRMGFVCLGNQLTTLFSLLFHVFILNSPLRTESLHIFFFNSLYDKLHTYPDLIVWWE